jgi:hypothetical protein
MARRGVTCIKQEPDGGCSIDVHCGQSQCPNDEQTPTPANDGGQCFDPIFRCID